MDVKRLLEECIPRRVQLIVERNYLRLLIRIVRVRQFFIQRRLAKKRQVRVVFLLILESSWKFFDLYREMEEADCIVPLILICPYNGHVPDMMQKEMHKIEKMCIREGYRYLNSWSKSAQLWLDLRKDVQADIVIITNPHEITEGQYCVSSMMGMLTCYIPYSIRSTNLIDLEYNQSVQNLVWRNYCESEIHLAISKSATLNRGKNVRVTGYPALERFEHLSGSPIQSDETDCWKLQRKEGKKRLIWAPHWTMPGAANGMARSCFLDYCEYFLDVILRYEDCLQVAIKPHPFLVTTLSKRTMWGKEKTRVYFDKWRQLENAQVQETNYFPLFISSDAMIHDSVSFLSEYLMLGKPVLFTSQTADVSELFNKFGLLAYECHYSASNPEEVEKFIADVVLGGNDSLREKRNEFKEQILYPGKITPSRAIVRDMLIGVGRAVV